MNRPTGPSAGHLKLVARAVDTPLLRARAFVDLRSHGQGRPVGMLMLVSNAVTTPGVLRFLKPSRGSRLHECLVQGCVLAAAYAEKMAFG